LPELIAGTLSAAGRADLEAHLASCPHCRRERQGLEYVCQLLTATPAPCVQVDLGSLHRAAAEEERLRARRWKRRALATALALAAVLLIGLLINLDIRIGDSELAVSWGRSAPPNPTRQLVQVVKERDPADQERFKVLQEL